MTTGEIRHLRRFGFGDIAGECAGDAASFLMHAQHNFGRARYGMGEKFSQPQHDKIHRREIIVEKHDMIKAGRVQVARGFARNRGCDGADDAAAAGHFNKVPRRHYSAVALGGENPKFSAAHLVILLKGYNRRLMTPTESIAELRRTLPTDSLLCGGDQIKPFESDALTVFRQSPMAVAIPENESQLIAVVKICRQAGVPIVARGAGTGLSGGALPHKDGVLLVTAKFDRVLHIDPLARIARVQPGVRNLAVSEEASACGLYYAPDPSSQTACSLGGNVAENSGGIRCLKYGLTVHNVLALRAVTIDGDIAEFGGAAGESAGFDLLALLHGSEGLLAVVTEITVRLLPKPESVETILAAFDDAEVAGDAVAAIIAAGIVPAGLEMMDRLAAQAAEDFAHAGYPTDAAAILICESDGLAEDVQADIAAIEKICHSHKAAKIRRAQNSAEREKIWRGRKSAFPAVGRIRPDYYCIDGTIPRRRLGETLRKINELANKTGLLCANVFHAGDGNLHPLILFDSAVAGETEKAMQLGSEILQLCIAVGGTITGEHGVGMEKINEMCIQFPPAELECFRQIKRAFDEHELLNPGKAVPTLNRCAEFGAMHVRRGEEPFPDLPRF